MDGTNMNDTASQADQGRNSAPMGHIEENIRAALKRGQMTGLEALTAYRDIGDGLNEAKQILPKGEFGPWAEAKFSFTKEWRARLMKLATSWSDVLEAMAWARELGRVMGRKEYGVDGALALVSEWHTATNPSAQAEAAEAAEKRERAKAEKAAQSETENDTLRRLLQEAMEHIAQLKELLNGKAHGKAKQESSTPGGGDTDYATVSMQDKAKARKLHALWLRPGTPAEGEAAKGRLQALAEKNGLTFAQFMEACNLSA